MNIIDDYASIAVALKAKDEEKKSVTPSPIVTEENPMEYTIYESSLGYIAPDSDTA